MATDRTRPDRVLLLALGTEPRDRAVQLIARRLREAGHEVVVGSRGDVHALVDGIAADERVVVGLSVGRGDRDVAGALELLRDRRGVRLFAGGHLDDDRTMRLASDLGARVFPLDVTTREVVAWIEEDDPAAGDRS